MADGDLAEDKRRLVEALPKWISVDDKLPTEGELVIYWSPEWKYWECGTYRAAEEIFESEATYGYDDEHHLYGIRTVTHWMPQSAIRLPDEVGRVLVEVSHE